MRMTTAGHNIPAWAEPPHFVTHLSLHHALVVMFHLLVIHSPRCHFLLDGRSLHQDNISLPIILFKRGIF